MGGYNKQYDIQKCLSFCFDIATNKKLNSYADRCSTRCGYYKKKLRWSADSFDCIGAYQINAATQQELFQAAHSTFGRITPLTQDSYHHQQDAAESEAMPAYSTITTDAGTQLIAAPTVDSSTLQQVW